MISQLYIEPGDTDKARLKIEARLIVVDLKRGERCVRVFKRWFYYTENWFVAIRSFELQFDSRDNFNSFVIDHFDEGRVRGREAAIGTR